MSRKTFFNRVFGREEHGCDYPWAEAPPWAIELRNMMGLILKLDQQMEKDNMASKETLDALNATVAANTNATHAAAAALAGYAKSNADLTAELQAAIANSEASDDADVKAAIDAITANNAALAANVPAAAAAVVENTPAA